MNIASRRLRAQRLSGAPFASVVDVVRWLGAVQSQDFGGAKWALAQRTHGTSDAEVDRLFDSGAVVRTHVLRPTWHFVLPEDVRWLLDLTSPRLLAGLSSRHRALGLDQRTVERAVDLFTESLSGGRHLTRAELGAVLLTAGISPEGQRLPHLLGAAEAKGVIVSGPRRGKEHTFAMLEERAPGAVRRDRDSALAELTSRYFRSHGPAQIQDFAWWSGLPVADIKRGLALVGSALEHDVMDGAEYWFDAESTPPGRARLTAHLLPNFDELTVAYRDRAALVDPKVPFDPSAFANYREAAPQGTLISNIVTVDGTVRGAWRRRLTPAAVRVEVRPLGPLNRTVQAAVARAVERFGRFLQLESELRIV
jgi:hypothetical protein